jgi:hypothetical protein
MVRALLFLVVGVGGAMLGGIVGLIIGGAVESATQQSGQPDVVYYAYSWTGLYLGMIIGFAGGIIWLGWRIGKREG